MGFWQHTLRYFFLALSWCVVPVSGSDDRSIPWEAGGLRLPNHSDLEIESCEISISVHNIDIVYKVRNNSNKDIVSPVYFDIPPYPFKNLHGQIVWDEEILEEVMANHARNNSWTLQRPSSQSIPFHNFTVWVNNKPVKTIRHVRASRCGTPSGCQSDVTDLLQKQGLPLSPIVASCTKIGHFSYHQPTCDKRLEALKKINLIDKNSEPIWHKAVDYHWTQQFKAQQTITIRHAYRPATGFVALHFDDERPPLEAFAVGILNTNNMMSDCCYSQKTGIDQDLIQWISRKFAQDLSRPEENQGAYLYIVDIDLSFLNTLLGNTPIKHFKFSVIHPKGGTLQTCPLWTSMTFERQSETRVSAETKNFIIPSQKTRVILSSPAYIQEVF